MHNSAENEHFPAHDVKIVGILTFLRMIKIQRLRDLKQNTSSLVGVLIFLAVENSCAVELSMKRFYGLGAWCLS